MSNQLNSTKGAELIEALTGRRCTRQNLEKLCERGALQGSPCILQAKPLRVDGDLLVSEYLARVAPHQAEARQPAAKREPPVTADASAAQSRRQPAQLPGDAPEDLPEYTISRARSEFEKANLLELQRRAQERELLRRDDVTQAWGQAVNLTRTKLLGVPSTVKQRIPHLEVDEIEVITSLIREALDELASGDVAA